MKEVQKLWQIINKIQYEKSLVYSIDITWKWQTTAPLLICTIRDALLFEIWSLLYDMFCEKSSEICSLKNVLDKIKKEKELCYKCGCGKENFIYKKDIENEIDSIRKKIIDGATYSKHQYLSNAYNEKWEKFNLNFAGFEKDDFFELINYVERIVRKIRILNGEKNQDGKPICIEFRRAHCSSMDAIELFKIYNEFVNKTQDSIDKYHHSSWKMKVVEEEPRFPNINSDREKGNK